MDGSRVAVYAPITLVVVEQTLGRRIRTLFDVGKHASKGYGRDLASRMAAAISYRTVFALAPMLVVAVSIAGFVLGGDTDAQATVIEAINDVAGPAVAEVMEPFLKSALMAADTAAVVGVLLLLWSSSTLFLELQRALNDIFNVPVPEERRILVLATQRAVGILWTVGAGILLVAVFVLGAALQIAGDAISSWLDTSAPFASVFGSLLSFALMGLVFALVFQTLTLRKLPWKPVFFGAGFTSAAFTLTGLLTGIYFREFGSPTALGISSSIVVIIFLAFLLSSVFLFGAEIARSYWLLVYERDENYLLFADPEPASSQQQGNLPLSLTAIATFLLGLLLGRKGKD